MKLYYPGRFANCVHGSVKQCSFIASLGGRGTGGGASKKKRRGKC